MTEIILAQAVAPFTVVAPEPDVSDPPAAGNVRSVNGYSGDVTLTPELLGAQPESDILAAIEEATSVVVAKAADGTLDNRALGVGSSTAIPTRGDADARFQGLRSVLWGAAGKPIVAAGAIPDLTSFARTQTAVANATFLGADDTTWEEAGADVPRFQGSAARLLREPACASMIANPRTVGSTGWARVNIATHVAADGPDGGEATGILLTESTATGEHYTQFATSGTATIGLPYAFLVLLKPGTCADVRVWFRSGSHSGGQSYVRATLSGDGAIAASGTNVARSRIEKIGDWYLVEIVANATAAAQVLPAVSFLNGSGTISFTGTSRTLQTGYAVCVQAGLATTPVLSSVGTPAVATRGRDIIGTTLAEHGIAGLATSFAGQWMLPRAAVGADQVLLQLGADANCYRLKNTAGGSTIALERVTAGAASAVTLGTMVAGAAFSIFLAIDGAGRAAASFNGGTIAAVTGGPTSVSGSVYVADNEAGTCPMPVEIGPIMLSAGAVADLLIPLLGAEGPAPIQWRQLAAPVFIPETGDNEPVTLRDKLRQALDVRDFKVCGDESPRDGLRLLDAWQRAAEQRRMLRHRGGLNYRTFETCEIAGKGDFGLYFEPGAKIVRTAATWRTLLLTDPTGNITIDNWCEDGSQPSGTSGGGIQVYGGTPDSTRGLPTITINHPRMWRCYGIDLRYGAAIVNVNDGYWFDTLCALQLGLSADGVPANPIRYVSLLGGYAEGTWQEVVDGNYDYRELTIRDLWGLDCGRQGGEMMDIGAGNGTGGEILLSNIRLLRGASAYFLTPATRGLLVKEAMGDNARRCIVENLQVSGIDGNLADSGTVDSCCVVFDQVENARLIGATLRGARQAIRNGASTLSAVAADCLGQTEACHYITGGGVTQADLGRIEPASTGKGVYALSGTGSRIRGYYNGGAYGVDVQGADKFTAGGFFKDCTVGFRSSLSSVAAGVRDANMEGCGKAIEMAGPRAQIVGVEVEGSGGAVGVHITSTATDANLAGLTVSGYVDGFDDDGTGTTTSGLKEIN